MPDMTPPININFINLGLHDHSNPSTPCVHGMMFKFAAPTIQGYPVTIFYNISKEEHPANPDFKIYNFGETLEIYDEETCIYYITARAYAANGQYGELHKKIYFQAAEEETTPVEPYDYEEDAPFTVDIYVVESDMNPEILVDNVPYTVLINATAGRGKVKLLQESVPSYIYADSLEEVTLGKFDESATFTIMVDPCREAEELSLVFEITDLRNNSVTTVTKTYGLAIESSRYPYKGNRVMWAKTKKAYSYNIYRCDMDGKHIFKVAHVLSDPERFSTYQWYIDRDGAKYDFYMVAPVDADGNEGDMSIPRCAPDKFDKLCLVQGSVIDLGAKGVDDVIVSYRITEVPTVMRNSLTIKYTHFVKTDDRGFFEVLLPQNSMVTLSVEDSGFRKSIVIPRSKAAKLEDILKMPQNQTLRYI